LNDISPREVEHRESETQHGVAAHSVDADQAGKVRHGFILALLLVLLPDFR